MPDPTPQIITRSVLDSAMEIFLFAPTGSVNGGGIILAQHIPVGHTGVENDEFTLAAAARLADAGYHVAVPFLFHWWDKSEPLEVKRNEARDDWMVADCQAAFELLTEHVDPTRISVVGHCWGGRVAWLYACHNPDLAACAVFYGGRIKIAMGEGQPPPISLASKIPCRIAGFFGNDDQNPTPADVDDYAAALQAAGVDYEFHRYDGAGHAFQNFPSPERYVETASEDAWRRLLAYLDEQLSGAGKLP